MFPINPYPESISPIRLALILAIMVLLSLTIPLTTAGTEAPLDQNNPDQTNLDHVIHPDLQDTSGEVKVFVRLNQIDRAKLRKLNRDKSISYLRSHAEKTQEPLRNLAATKDGINYINSFWITNAVTLKVNLSSTSLAEIASVPNVERISPIHQVEVQGSITTQGDNNAGYDTTWGIDKINAPEVWKYYDTMGGGIKVSVIDTGVDINHTDLDLYTDNESDPTYPGGWAEFDSNGNQVTGSTPHDTENHGSHVHGTVSGDNASGEYIGVAPNVSMMHALSLPDGSASIDQLIAGMQWSVDNGADVMSMSFGGPCGDYFGDFVDPVINARDAGVHPIAVVGNCNSNASRSPGNVYDAYSVGAVNKNDAVWSSSGGETVNKSDWHPSDQQQHWPDQWIEPNVTAPGVDIKSADSGGGYVTKKGTSQAAPHVSGASALVQAATETNLSIDEIESYLDQSAWKPEGAPEGQDIEYGKGIINVLKAVSLANVNSTVQGNVTSTSGVPLANVTVSTNLGLETTTNSSGWYSLDVPDMNQSLTATEEVVNGAPLNASVSHNVSPPSGGVLTRDFQLSLESCLVVTKPGSYSVKKDWVSDEASSCINVSSSDVLVDVAGHRLDGNSSDGIGVYVWDNSSNVTVRNASIRNWETGINLNNTSGVQIESFDVDNVSTGAALNSSDDVNITQSSILNASNDTVTLKSSTSTLHRLTMDSAYLSMKATSIVLGAVDQIPEEPQDYLNISYGVWANDSGVGSPHISYIEMKYNDVDIPMEMNENSLRMWLHSSGSWSEIGTNNSVNTDANIVHTESILGTGLIAPLGKKKPGNFTVESITEDSPVLARETINVTSTINNTGYLNATQQITLLINGSSMDSTNVTLTPGNNTTITLRWNTSLGDHGVYNASISSQNDTASTNTSVNIPPIANLSNPPNDLNDDGLYRDTDGDSALTANDVQVYFDNRRTDEVINAYVPEFDYNNDSSISIGDVQRLWLDIFN